MDLQEEAIEQYIIRTRTKKEFISDAFEEIIDVANKKTIELSELYPESIEFFAVVLRKKTTHYNLNSELLKEIIIKEVGIRDISKKSRKREYVIARKIFCFIMKSYTNLTLKEIGRQVGGIDHSTVIHNIGAFKDEYSIGYYNNLVNRIIEEAIDQKLLNNDFKINITKVK